VEGGLASLSDKVVAGCWPLKLEAWWEEDWASLCWEGRDEGGRVQCLRARANGWL